VLLPIAARDVTQSAAVSPVLTKLYRESSLRRSSRTVILNPATARELSVRGGREAILETEEGKARVMVATDESVMPGVAALVIGPEPEALGDPPGHARIVDICPADANGVWRRGTARLVEG
jgi:anaerobic selenocysteine-containing dehydrogenase